jgi:hypothetical protein
MRSVIGLNQGNDHHLKATYISVATSVITTETLEKGVFMLAKMQTSIVTLIAVRTAITPKFQK